VVSHQAVRVQIKGAFLPAFSEDLQEFFIIFLVLKKNLLVDSPEHYMINPADKVQ
jgi:hypothetical protein